MSCKIVLFVLSFFLISESFAGNQKDTLLRNPDSLKISNLNDGYFDVSDSIIKKRAIKDSVSFYFLKPDKTRPNLYFEHLLENFIVKDALLLHPAKSILVRKIKYGTGKPVYKMPLWILLSTITLIIGFVIAKVIFKKQVSMIFRAFYDTKILHQISKEDQMLASWPFIFLYLIFSLSIGLIVCLILSKTNNIHRNIDFNTFLIISFLAFAVFSLKVLILKLLGYFFRIQKLEKEYTKVVYLTYFNFLFFLLPIIFWLSLVDIKEQQIIFWMITSLSVLIISIQYLRIVINILLNLRLSKFYLILYLCTLEICPILILARTIHNSF